MKDKDYTLFDGGWTLETCTENHVHFMDRSDYIPTLFRLAMTPTKTEAP